MLQHVCGLVGHLDWHARTPHAFNQRPIHMDDTLSQAKTLQLRTENGTLGQTLSATHTRQRVCDVAFALCTRKRTRAPGRKLDRNFFCNQRTSVTLKFHP